MHVQVFTASVTTDGSGAGTGYTGAVNGLLSRAVYVKTDFADGVDFTITLEDTGETLWAEANVNASTSRAPRQSTHSTAGAASLYAAAGQAVNDLIAVNGRIKVVVAQGGANTVGTFRFFVF